MQTFVGGYIFTCTLQTAVTCLVSGVPDVLGIWILEHDCVENLCLLVRQLMTFVRHSTELFAYFHTFSASRWTSDPGPLVSGSHLVVFASRSTGKIGIGR